MRWLRRILTGGPTLVDYVPIGLKDIDVKATLTSKDLAVDVTDDHFTLAYNPLVIGIVLPVSFDIEQNARLIFADESGQSFAGLDLKYFKLAEAVSTRTHHLFLFHVKGSSCKQLNSIRRNVILGTRFFINRRAGKFFGSLSYSLHRHYAAAFSFPRPVSLVTVKNGSGFKSFPVDLHGKLKGSDFCVWAIRHSNNNNDHILKTGKVILSKVPFDSYQKVYQLGKFGKAQAVQPDQLIVTKCWSYEVPEFVSKYMEIEVLGSDDIGSQRLFVGKVISEMNLKNDSQLHHVHLLQYLERYHKSANAALNISR
jgi:hypothetical protein